MFTDLLDVFITFNVNVLDLLLSDLETKNEVRLSNVNGILGIKLKIFHRVETTLVYRLYIWDKNVCNTYKIRIN